MNRSTDRKLVRHLLVGLWLILIFILVPWPTRSFADEPPLKVFILVGQSNMQGHADVKTLPHMAMSPEHAELCAKIMDMETGEPNVIDNVWISYLSSNGEKTGPLTTGFGANEKKIGPELAFGISMSERLKQPILIIKTAWGGKSINTDFRSPSAGPYEFNEQTLAQYRKQNKDIDKIRQEKEAATGQFYKKTIEHIQSVLADIKRVYPDYNPKVGYQLSGVVWFQGWNDMVDRGTYPKRDTNGGYDAYSDVLSHFIRDIRKDLNAPNLPFVIGVLGVGGPVDKYTEKEKRYQKVHQNFRDAMAAPASNPEFQGNVVAVKTEEAWDLELAALIERDDEIRNRIKRLKKEDRLNEIIQELKGGE
ncbi:MAG: sialate O-acetylesterase, partial [Pirellulaceae bacterium]|nr:sialate O-acetylesterase [Pirellulaceae bacterium]